MSGREENAPVELLPESDLRADSVLHLQRVVALRVEAKSLRGVAREIGMSPTGLKRFLQGTTPYSPTLRRLRRWYLQTGWKYEAAYDDWFDVEKVRRELDAYARNLGSTTAPRASPSAESSQRSHRISTRTQFLVGAFESDAELARMLGIDPDRVARLRQGDALERGDVERLVGLDAVLELLMGFLDERSIPKWLEGTNAHLGDRRPIDVLQQGRLSEVIAAIEAEKSGAYA